MAALKIRRALFARALRLGATLTLFAVGIIPAAAMSDAARTGQSIAHVPGEAGVPTRWRPHVEEASRRFGIPAAWIEQVMMAESGGHTVLQGRPIVSSAGAMGLMQLMPGTWAEMRRRLGLGADPHAPRDNILAGTLYLRLMHDRFGYPGLFGAYNAGPARYAAYLAGRQRLPGETRSYLIKVAGTLTSAGTKKSVRVSRNAEGMEIANPAADDGAQSLFFIRRPVPARSKTCAATGVDEGSSC